ncbi:MAG TPA: cytochrome c maturation protein CcmE [Chthonomonadales bacterium]|nr:cytochrome c maturation protein CcmE [Chthonomonadales bacterium]
MRAPHIVALAVVVVAMVVAVASFSGTVSRHVSVSEAMQSPGRTVQVPGQIVEGSVRFDPVASELRFTVTDPRDASMRMDVVYGRPRPENFDAATSVQVIGSFRDGAFRADRLLVKCPSRYSDEAAAAPVAAKQ